MLPSDHEQKPGRLNHAINAASVRLATLSGKWDWSAHAWRVWFSRYAGILAPNQMRVARNVRRRSDGVVSTTYAAATAADTRTTLATRRTVGLVTALASPRVAEPARSRMDT
jgi:hypothetical protein